MGVKVIKCLNKEKKPRINGAFSQIRQGQWLAEIWLWNPAEEVSGRKLTRRILSAPQVTFIMNRDSIF